jgi:hypothetical protein
VSFASLRRIRPATGPAEARALLAALGLVGHVGAFGRPFNLRSGADLRPRASTWLWLGSEGNELLEVPDFAQATALFKGCAERAEAAGLPVGGHWASEPLVLQPAPNLAEAIRKSWPSD